MQRGTNQLRLGIFRVSLVMAIAVLFGIIGLYSLTKNQPSRTLNAKTTAATSAVQTPAAITSLDIKEWHVHLKLDTDTADMYYYIHPDLPNVAYLSLQTVSGIAPNCAANKISLGAISRLTPAEHQAALNDPTKGLAGTIHIGNYWYAYSSSPSSCVQSAAQGTAVIHALPTFNRGTLANRFNTLATD